MRNFKYEKYQKFDLDIVLASLNANKPVYISGEVYGIQAEDENDYGWERHAFVIDGYMIRIKLPVMSPSSNVHTRSDIVQYYDMYWHINLGWGAILMHISDWTVMQLVHHNLLINMEDII